MSDATPLLPPGGPPAPPPGCPPPPPPSPPEPVPREPAPPEPAPPPARRSPAGPAIGLGLVGALVLGGVVVAIGASARRAEDPAPRARIDHWHAAYGVYLCDRYLPAVEGGGDRAGIHSHGDGVVHIEPLNATSAGPKAVFRRFEEAQQLRITSSLLRWVDGPSPIEVDVRRGCAATGRDSEIATFVDGRRVGGEPGRIRLRDGQVVVVAVVPKGTTYDQIGPPPSLADLPRIRGIAP